MIKNDYLMRIIEQATAVLGRVLRLLQNDQIEQAETLIGEALGEYTGLTLDELDALPAEQLLARVGHFQQGGLGQQLMLAELLQTRARVALARGDDEMALYAALRALQIRLTLALGHDVSNARLDSAIDDLLRTQLADVRLPTATLAQLFDYYEKTTQFDRAENVLWTLIDDHFTDEDMVQAGLAFYERLLRKSDSELRTGNLSRAEVEEAFDELWERRG